MERWEKEFKIKFNPEEYAEFYIGKNIEYLKQFIQKLLEEREEEVITELCVIAGIREVNDRQFHIILKEYNKKKSE